jgi:hypothetical protein
MNYTQSWRKSHIRSYVNIFGYERRRATRQTVRCAVAQRCCCYFVINFKIGLALSLRCSIVLKCSQSLVTFQALFTMITKITSDFELVNQNFDISKLARVAKFETSWRCYKCMMGTCAQENSVREPHCDTQYCSCCTDVSTNCTANFD